QKLVEGFRKGCAVFGDHESLSRLGRTYKNAGDKAWEKRYESGPAVDALVPRSPAWQQYEMALKVYEEAFRLTGHHYPGINAASLALLLKDVAKAQALARQVAEICADPDAFTRDDHFWVYATEGEAALVLEDYGDAR